MVAMGKHPELESSEGWNGLDIQGDFFSHLSGIWAGSARTTHDWPAISCHVDSLGFSMHGSLTLVRSLKWPLAFSRVHVQGTQDEAARLLMA